MCAISELGCRARQFTNALLSNGYITGEQFPVVLAHITEQMALTTAAMMAEVRLRSNAIQNERAVVDQISREVMKYISGRQQERTRQRRKVREAFEQLREEAYQNTAPFTGEGRREFFQRYPEVAQNY